MKKILGLGLVWGLIFIFACEEGKKAEEAGGIFSFGGGTATPEVWDLMLNQMGGLEEYYIKVISSGSVSVEKKAGSGREFLSYFSVYSGAEIPLTPEGPIIKFAPKEGFNLVSGDEWAALLDSGQAIGIFSTKTNTSDVSLSIVSGTVSQKCIYGLFKSFPGIDLSPMGANIQLSSARGLLLNRSEYQLSGDAPESSLLLFSTNPFIPAIAPGDTIGISYAREMVSDRAGGDFLLVRFQNDRALSTIESIRNESASLQTTNATFTANGIFFGLEFISGLSSASDYIRLDDFIVRINGAEVFRDDFETSALKNGLPNYLWQPAKPLTMLGSAGVCDTNPVSGTYSYCINGGRSFKVYGQGMSAGGISGLQFTLSDGSLGSSYFVGGFLGKFSGPLLVGSYQGRNYEGDCREKGEFFANINPALTPDLTGNYTIQIQGQLKNCDDPEEEQAILLQITAPAMLQVNSLFGGMLTGMAPGIDSLGNTVSAQGIVNGNSLMLIINTSIPASARFYRLTLHGLANTTPITGQAIGWTTENIAPSYPACELEGMFSLSIAP